MHGAERDKIYLKKKNWKLYCPVQNFRLFLNHGFDCFALKKYFIRYWLLFCKFCWKQIFLQ